MKIVKHVGTIECEDQVSMRYVQCSVEGIPIMVIVRHISVGSTPLEYTLSLYPSL